MNRFNTGQHRFYCEIDLRTSTLSRRGVDSTGAIVRRFRHEVAYVNSQGWNPGLIHAN